MAAPRSFVIKTYGCQMNEHDSERLAGLLVADGMVPAESVETADLVVLNTCCIRENADNRLYAHLGDLKALREQHPDLQIAVGGCLAQKDRGLVLERAEHVDVVFGTHNLAAAPSLLRRARAEGPIVEILDAPEPTASGDQAPALTAVRDLPWAAWMTIQTGCDNSCAFCIVPSVRGKEVSRPMDALMDEARGLARRGVVELTVLGQNVNSYGRDLTRRRPLFASLLRELGSVEGIERLRFTSPHPKDLRDETIEAMAETSAVCEQLHLPLQSGSDRVLTAMRRGYRAERYLARLAAARAAIEDLAVTTDLIVGFPGETDRDFDDTLEVVAAAQFDSAFTFVFSPRPGTRAAAMSDSFVPPEVVKERFARLVAVIERSALRHNEARVGLVEDVLVEGTSKKDPSRLTARTRQGKPVHFEASSDVVAAGSFARVEITHGAPHHLLGDLVEVTARPRFRSRIPIAAR
ncbi:MAG TPA: tRNA (N6-isopentenyl adenosine(37)-C2)-methylthiotransferase MiaB [Acidimicrobiales bacterium]|nr:tRNA (N6-isopentenyl adenosine(37)-C2)-methylthiotransferase MiaB [Acidimicrobiales bacterium]